jgi:hypothetical protein
VPAASPVSWVVAQRGETKMLCEEDGAGLFGTPEVKDTAEMDGDAPLEAVMRDGYWFLPADLGGSAPIAYRGYDEDGELVHYQRSPSRQSQVRDCCGSTVTVTGRTKMPPSSS